MDSGVQVQLVLVISESVLPKGNRTSSLHFYGQFVARQHHYHRRHQAFHSQIFGIRQAACRLEGSWPDNQPSGVYSGGPYSWQDPAVYYQKVDAGKDWCLKMKQAFLPSRLLRRFRGSFPAWSRRVRCLIRWTISGAIKRRYRWGLPRAFPVTTITAKSIWGPVCCWNNKFTARSFLASPLPPPETILNSLIWKNTPTSLLNLKFYTWSLEIAALIANFRLTALDCPTWCWTGTPRVMVRGWVFAERFTSIPTALELTIAME
jgi:hypothetical protein